MRYNNTERLGVIESERVFTKEFNWIFREQSIADFGVDAIIEEVKESDPTGRLIAAQIKTGLGNFHYSNKILTYYVSNTHYNYWLGYVLPVILIAYLPESDNLLWQIVSKDTLKKTPNKWKIEIPKNNILNNYAKPEFTEILDLRFRNIAKREPFQGDPMVLDIYSIVENVNYIKDASNSTLRFVSTLTEMDITVKNYNQKINLFASQGCSKTDRQVIATINKFAHELILFAKRIRNEIEIFTELFGLGFSSYMQASTIYYSLTREESIIKETKNGLNAVFNSINEAENSLRGMQNSIRKLPKTYPRLKEARNKLVEVMDIVLDEYNVAKEFLREPFA
ncbi:MAG: hypothetical protein A2X13_14225 [Bacteroidetes bacterium GWC2_33_15]|nr:MAG: hypothetical protein A2X10_12270 [Bacteroidetes bacterium GWA2_33_15]OFX50032.1 MAG: hypothetical protein A2X13_14225 [Bacteroidetes bacterium GWC2_33_15]OFX65186.1 MAG: hypothetical protein A2X15_03800 [Bacteroidetes bacterium GWB2_32_14]OFX70411.1 MAG: hypothetical protein A2X14_03855 [Bacteroidetes bacterium GWD2_33_33]HAN19721.1 hypothetical protein [Bacteroidales bacterium]